MATLSSYTVSRETQDRLDLYAALLSKWQPKINLVSPDTIKDAETRHFQDSIQLLPLLKDADKTLIDLGSGAGFPGLALAIARPDMEIHLVESDARKCEFLRTVSRETRVPVTVHTSRIETLPPFGADVMTARALASLDKLLGFAVPFAALNPDLRLIFLKGETWQAEIAEARKSFDFDIADYQSQTNPRSRILVIAHLQQKS